MGLGHSPGREPSAGDHVIVHRRVQLEQLLTRHGPDAPSSRHRRGLYTHHGIYLGGGRFAHKVAGTAPLGVAISSVDAASRGQGKGGVVLTDLTGFCPEAAHDSDYSRLEVVSYAQCFHPEDTIELALATARGPRSSVTGPLTPLRTEAPYQLLSHNCEHFATFCKTGEHVSLQVLAVRGAVHRFGALAAGAIAGTATLARLEFVERTTTKVEHHPGGVLGLRRRKVVTTETEVDPGPVLAGAAIIGVVSAVTFGLVAKLQASLWERRRYILAVRLCADGATGKKAGCDCTTVLVVPRRVVAQGKASLLRFLVHAMEGAPLAPDLRFWSSEAAAFVPLGDDCSVALPRCATVTVVLAPAGKAPAMA